MLYWVSIRYTQAELHKHSFNTQNVKNTQWQQRHQTDKLSTHRQQLNWQCYLHSKMCLKVATLHQQNGFHKVINHKTGGAWTDEQTITHVKNAFRGDLIDWYDIPFFLFFLVGTSQRCSFFLFILLLIANSMCYNFIRL